MRHFRDGMTAGQVMALVMASLAVLVVVTTVHLSSDAGQDPLDSLAFCLSTEVELT